MEDLDYWRLCDELSIIQAALLIAGCDPSGDCAYVEEWRVHDQPKGYAAAKAALTNAILAGRLPALVRRAAWTRGWDEEPGDGQVYEKTVHIFASDLTEAGFPEIREGSPGSKIRARGVIYRAEPDWHLTTISVDTLKKWLASRGICTGFFFPTGSDAPDYLDPNASRYAPKLAAAIRAWQAVTDPNGKHPKQALAKWLREHAAEFSLTDEEGKPNETGIEEAAKVANWQPGGGAPKTP